MHLIWEGLLNYSLDYNSRVAQDYRLCYSLFLGYRQTLPKGEHLNNIVCFRFNPPGEFGFHLFIRVNENPPPAAPLHHKIVRVYPQLISLPPFDSSSFEPFCWSELLLYKPFRSIPQDIGTTTPEIISHWQQIKGTYNIWHVEHAQEEPSTLLSYDSNFDAITFPLPHSMYEW